MKPIETITNKLVARNQLVTVEDLETFKQELLIGIRSLFVQHTSPAPKKWMKTYEVRKLLDISRGTLNTLRNNGTIPSSKIGGIVYYDAEEVNRVFESKKRNPIQYQNSDQ